MERSIDEGLIRAVAGNRVVDSADSHVVTADLEVQAETPVEPAPVGLDVRRVDHPTAVVLTLGGELDLVAAPVLQEWLERSTRDRAAVVIDLSGLSFIDSSGLQLLVRAERQLRDSGVQLVLVRGPRAVHRLFELTSLDSRFEFCDSPSAALHAARATHWVPADPKPGANRQTAAELDRERGGVMWS